MEQEVKILRGIPGSGKSTYAQEWVKEDTVNRARVNRDDIRFELFGKYVILDKKGQLDKDAEQKVTQREHQLIQGYLREGKSVVIDNTNLGFRNIKPYFQFARQAGAKISHRDFPISLAEAQRRNAGRDRVVDPKVIERMYRGLGPNGEFHLFPGSYKTTPFKAPETRKTVICVDLDGTLDDVRPVRHFVRRSPRNFDMFHRSSLFTPPNPEVLKMVMDAHKLGIPIIITTARDEAYRDVSEKWLREVAKVPFENMYMRPRGDSRPDYIVKTEMLEKIRKHYDVARCIDDNPQAVEAWRAAGIEVTEVPGFDEGTVGENEVIKIDNVFARGGCIRCGKPLKNGGYIGARCAQFSN